MNVLVCHLALAPGGSPAPRFADRLMAPVGKETLLRQLRRPGQPGFAPPRVIGIDDWAWRRNQRYRADSESKPAVHSEMMSAGIPGVKPAPVPK